MSSIDRAVQVIRAHDADGACNEPECLAQDLADAGLLMPELPQPITAATDPEWEQRYLEDYEWVPDAEWHPTDAFFINVKDGNVSAGFWEAQENWEGMNPADLKAIGLALLAAAQSAEKQAGMTTPTGCMHRLHAYPLPESYLAAHAEAERRLSKGWRTKKCLECGIYGWEKP